MDRLCQELTKQLPKGMQIPEPLKLLYAWIDSNRMYYDSERGYRVGLLFPEKELKAGWREKERPGGTHILFYAQESDRLGYWFGFTDKRTKADLSLGKGRKVLDRLCIFARTGSDGSMAALWLADDGKQRVVHLGSGSGSTLVCVLAEDVVDFFRLLAVGYDEICWQGEFGKPPNSNAKPGDQIIKANKIFREWVIDTFRVSIPETATEIVKHPAGMDDKKSEDMFFQWTKKQAI